MIIKSSNALKSFLFLSSVVYGWYLAWLPIDAFIDRDNYLLYIQDSGAVLNSNLSESYFYLFSNEPLWLLINQLVGIFLSPEDGVRFFIFSSGAFFCFSAGKQVFFRDKSYLLAFSFFIFLILCPQILKNFIVHLRQGVALAVFFLFAGASSSLKRNVLVAFLAAQIHSSFYFLFAIFFGSYFFGRIGFGGKKSLFVNSFAILLLASFASFLPVFFEARQSVVFDELSQASGAAFLFWLAIVIFISFLLFKNESYCDDWRLVFSFCAILLYLSLYYSFPYSGRIFESCLPLIVIFLFGLPQSKLRLLLIPLFSLFVYQWSPLLVGDTVFRLAG